jgi:hypothetical protein
MNMTKGTPVSSQIVWLEGRVQELEAENEKLRAALEKIVAMDEVALIEWKKGDGWLHQRVARAALEGK